MLRYLVVCEEVVRCERGMRLLGWSAAWDWEAQDFVIQPVQAGRLVGWQSGLGKSARPQATGGVTAGQEDDEVRIP